MKLSNCKKVSTRQMRSPSTLYGGKRSELRKLSKPTYLEPNIQSLQKTYRGEDMAEAPEGL
jgi:hypothetical protein